MGAEAWETAELHLLEQAFRERLSLLDVEATPDVAVALMAVAHLLAEHTAEWGGDARDSLGEIALLGFTLLGSEGTAGPPGAWPGGPGTRPPSGA